MRTAGIVLTIALLLSGGVRSTAIPEPRQSGVPAGARLYVVPVRDSGLFTLCPAKWIDATPEKPLMTSPRDGEVVVSKGLFRNRPWMDVTVWKTRERARLSPPPNAAASQPIELDRGLLTLDDTTAAAVREEIGARRAFAVVDSLPEAEYVLLVEARHEALAFFSGRSDEGAGGAIGVYGDREANFRTALLAMLVPAAAYRAHGPDAAALLGARRWDGAALAYSPSPSRALPQRFPASVRALADYLHGSATRPEGFPSVCAASLPSSIHAGENEVARLPGGLRDDVLPVAPPGRRAAAPEALFRSGVTYVSVPVVVGDGAGRAVAGLSASDFRVYENEVEQRIDRLLPVTAAVTLGLVLDTSASMRDEWSRLRMPILRFLAALPSDHRLLLASVDERVLLHADAGSGRQRIREALDRIDRRTGTRLYDGVALVASRMEAVAERKALVLLTDGVDTRSRLADAESTLALIGESHLPVYAIQYDTRRSEFTLPWAMRSGGLGIRDMTPLILPNEAFDNTALFARADAYLAGITTASGGRLYRAESLVNLDEAFAQVVADLGKQYTLGYYPTNQARDGTYRALRVEVDRAGLSVTTRPGYRAAAR